MVSVNCDGVKGVLKEVSPVFERVDDGEHFFVVDVVVELGSRHLA